MLAVPILGLGIVSELSLRSRRRCPTKHLPSHILAFGSVAERSKLMPEGFHGVKPEPERLRGRGQVALI